MEGRIIFLGATMKRFLLSLFVISFALAQDKENDETRTTVWLNHKGYVVSNGKGWKELDTQSKIMYLNGIEEGVRLFLLNATSGEYKKSTGVLFKVENNLIISGFHFSDLVEQVNDFYSDASNLRIPVIEAYAYTVRKMKGDTPQELQLFQSLLRKKYNQ
jgi:hypothetical protein